ncbi:tRNA pseudouridine synthase B [Amylibacter marinus]|uniref:tRNA pseudouridine synthase B n=1 Tax=Amylibacter marinus TaxID=1475483 RepID=A0ABQ5VWF9_9RHOB|nr:tRNA pseudouridine(55) synthase TruB [Amylibacter marinus]GLQ35757.1 tRNA pseudouridine synthase B [Amylibacter marinus]
MARRKKGNRVNGWLLIDKPAGITSSAVVNKVKWALNAQKAGHAGTLDPEATGLLAVALGEATKTVPYVTDGMKAYTFIIRLGQATNTDDAEGEVISASDTRPTDTDIEQALGQFIGDIQQIPPQFSAVRVDGQRAYKLARDGEELDLHARDLFVEDLKLVSRIDDDHAELELICGKGGYVRAIARDLGASLGCFAHVKTLRRIWSCALDVEDAIQFTLLDELAKQPELLEYLHPLELGLADLPELHCRIEEVQKLRNGNPAMVTHADLEYGDEAWVSCNGEPLAIGTYKAGQIHPSRVFVPE